MDTVADYFGNFGNFRIDVVSSTEELSNWVRVDVRQHSRDGSQITLAAVVLLRWLDDEEVDDDNDNDDENNDD